MPERAEKIATAVQAAVDVRRAEGDLEDARARLAGALRDAHGVGVSYAELGRNVGLTRERVAQIVKSPE